MIKTVLQKYLDAQGITQAELARRLKESTVVVNAWVRGLSKPKTFAKLRKLHRVTGISYAELVGDRVPRDTP